MFFQDFKFLDILEVYTHCFLRTEYRRSVIELQCYEFLISQRYISIARTGYSYNVCARLLFAEMIS